MESSHWHELEEKYEYGQTLDPEARTRWLATLAETHPEIAPTLRQMFAQTGEHDAYFEDSPGTSKRPIIEPEAQVPKDTSFPQVRNYVITDVIDEGGMGVVYLATQQSPVQRQVALKIIHSHCASQEYWQRFFVERDILAKMKHANIASLFDSGFTDDGRPFFSMEYIEGEPITDYCQNHRLKAPDRIRLFLQVCQGMLHAHQKMVIHRDLKPSNILVVHQNGQPIVKIIDFGISKQLDPAEKTARPVTEIGSYMGTIPYLSPEQATGKGSINDTRTDLYALGVLLYELLTGMWPFNNKLIETGYLDQKLRIVREEDPVPPSKRLEAHALQCQQMAANMAMKPAALLKTFKGDLDWVLLRAIAKNPDDRYPSVIGLIQDLEAFLEHRPVIARPPSLGYQWAKFYQRYRFAVWALTAILVTVIGGLIATLISYQNTLRAQARALDAKEQQDLAFNYLKQVFTTLTPDKLGKDVTVLEAIESQIPYMDDYFGDQILAKTFAQSVFADIFNALGQYQKAEELYLEAYKNRALLLGLKDSYTWNALNNLASNYTQMEKNAEALNIYQEAKTLQDQAKATRSETYATTLFGLALSLKENDRRQATVFCQQAMTLLQALGKDEEQLYWKCKEQLGMFAAKGGDLDKGIEILSSVHGWLQKKLGPEKSDTLRVKAQLGQVMDDAENEEGLKIFEDAVRVMFEKLSPSHQWVVSLGKNLAKLLSKKGRLEESEVVANLTYERANQYFEGTPLVLTTAITLAKTFKLRECMQEAIELLEVQPMFDDRILVQDSEHERALLNNLGDYLAISGKSTRGLWFLEEALEKKLATIGPGNSSTITTLFSMTELHLRIEDYETSLVLAENSRALVQAYYPKAPRYQAFSLGLLGLSQRGCDPASPVGEARYREALDALAEKDNFRITLIQLGDIRISAQNKP